VSSSLKHPSELFEFPPSLLPDFPRWANYARVFEKVPFMDWIGNTAFVVSLGTAGRVLTAALAGYAFARFDFRGKYALFMITLATMMLPPQVTLIPQFIVFHKLKWIDTLKPMWIPNWFGGGAFSIFLMRQFMLTLPRALDESAVIDGASYARIFWSILLPLCKPALATLAVISIMQKWNSFLGPLIWLNSEEKFTLAVGLNYFKNVPEIGGEPMQHLMMAASVMSTAPLIVLFFSAQRYFVRGIALTGIKG
jgi:multiple sugar transport system permease protein